MAIWQCDFQLIPQDMIEYLEQEELWRSYSVSKKSLEIIAEVLPETRAWTEDIIQYGENDDTCIQLFCENDIICDIKVRISFRDLDLNKLKVISEFAKVNMGILIFNKKIILPEVDEIINTIRYSDAAKFSAEPMKYLDDLSK